MEVVMARVMVKKAHARHLDNDDASTMSVNQYHPIGHKPALAFHVHQRHASSAVANQTHCTRCGGLMVQEFYIDLRDSIEGLTSPAKRCVQCGEVIDLAILINRQQVQLSMPIQLEKEMSPNYQVTKGR
jgi:hypothetical protein